MSIIDDDYSDKAGFKFKLKVTGFIKPPLTKLNRRNKGQA